MASSSVPASSNVLLVASPGVDSSVIASILSYLRDAVGQNGVVDLEQSDRIMSVPLTPSKYDIVLLGYVVMMLEPPPSTLLEVLLKALKPNGELRCQFQVLANPSAFSLQLKLAGFLNPQAFPSLGRVEVLSQKPNYELGSSLSLGLKLKPKLPQNEQAKTVWKISANDFDDEDTINDDNLLDEVEIRMGGAPPIVGGGCETKKKACKNCTCGRAEEEENETSRPSLTAPLPASSCGNV